MPSSGSNIPPHIPVALAVPCSVEPSRDAFAAAFYRGPLPSLFTVLATGRIVDVNEAFCDLFDHPREGVLGRTTEEIGLWVDPADRRRLVCQLQAGGSLRGFEAFLRARTGAVRRLVFSSSMVELEGEPCIVSALIDVTDRLVQEERLGRREARLARQNATLSQLTRREAEFFQDVRAAVRVLTAAAAHTIEAQRASIWLYDDARSRITAVDIFDDRAGRHDEGSLLEAERYPVYFEALASGQAIDAGDAWRDPRTIELRDGYLAALGIGALLDVGIFVGGRVAGVLCVEHVGDARVWTVDEQSFVTALAALMSVVLEVAERRRLEEQLRQASRMEAVGLLAGGVAHDFNNLLTVINGFSGLILEELRPGDPLRDDLESIRDAGARAATLTGQLLAFSRKQILEPRVIDLNQTVGAMTKMLERLIGEDVTLELSLQPDLLPVLADPGQIEQVIANLVVNARDAMVDGGRLTVSTANIPATEVSRDDSLATARGKRLRVGVVNAATTVVVLRVTDTGTGMTDLVRDRIFDPFFTTKGPTKGTGLGLSTVYGIVTQSGGSIAVDSAPGLGTTIEVCLPSADGELSQAPTLMPSVSGGWETVLVVEDEPAVRKLTTEVLRRAGYAVLSAGSPGEALALLHEAEDPVHLLLTDVVMPGMSGRRLAERISARWPGTPVLFMSGYTEDDVLQRGVVDQALAFLRKPFTRGELLRKVREALDARRTPQR